MTESKFIFDKTPIEKIQKRAGNVKIVVLSDGSKVYICPYPPSHFGDLQKERQKAITFKRPKLERPR